MGRRIMKPPPRGRRQFAPVPLEARLAPATFTVNSVLDLPDASPGDGLARAADGSSTLRAAVTEANFTPGIDTIVVPAGLYTLAVAGPDEDAAATGDLDVKYPLEIVGAGAGETVIDGYGLDRVFDIRAGAHVAIGGVTVRGGDAAVGGAIRNSGFVSLTRVRLLDNSAGQGGALANLAGAVAVVTETAFAGNSAIDGGAVVNRGILTVEQSAVYDNVADDRGGGIWNDAKTGILTVRSSTFSNNTAGDGGGLANTGGASSQLFFVTTAANSARRGGGVANLNGSVVLASTLAGTNHATEAGRDLFGSFTSLGFNLVQNIDGASLQGTPTGNRTGIDPRLGPLADRGGFTPLHPLLPDSPAIDAGTVPPGGAFVDQRGRPRQYDLPNVVNAPSSDASDIGAFEFSGGTATVNSLADTDVRDSLLTLREAFLIATKSLAYADLTPGEQAQLDGDPGSLDAVRVPLAGVIDLQSALPAFPERLSFTGHGADRLTIRRADGAPAFRIFDVPFGAVATVTDVTLAGGQANQGGNVRNAGDLTLERVGLTAGTANEGGGLYSSGTATVRRSAFYANTANFGGGVSGPGTLALRSSTVSGNTGGGVRVSGPAELAAVTIAHNTGAGLIVDGSVTRSINALFAYNTGGSLIVGAAGLFTSLGHNVAADAPAALNRPGDRVNADARLGALALSVGPTPVHLPLPGSAALDAGTPSAFDVTDQRGLPRWSGSAPDVGAVEARPYAVTLLDGSNQTAKVGQAFAVPLRVRLTEGGDAAAGAQVTFELPATGPTATATAPLTVLTDGNGVAVSPVLTAAGGSGPFAVRALVSGLNPVTFWLTNTPSPIAQLDLAVAAEAVAGVPVLATLTIRDQFGNVMTDFTGTVQLSANDGQATGLGEVAFTPADQGVRAAAVTLRTAGPRTITVTGTNLNASANVNVRAAAASRFDITGLPGSVRAGDGTAFTLTARDAFGNLADAYLGTVDFVSDDPLATLPAAFAFTADDRGTVTLSATLRAAGPRTLLARDRDNGAINATVPVTVTPAAAVVSLAALPATVTAGEPLALTLTARDIFGNAVPDFAAAASVTTNDAAATVPAIAFTANDGGVRSGTLTLRTAGPRTVTVSVNGQTLTAAVAVTPAAASRLELSGVPATAVAGSPISLTVTAFDPFGNVATGYGGTVAVTSSDTAMSLPGPRTFTAADAGRVTLTLTPRSAGSRTITFADGNLSVTTTIAVTPGGPVVAVTGVPGAATAGDVLTVTLTARDAFGNVVTDFAGPVVFASSDSAASLPAAAALGPADGGTRSFPVILKTAGARALTVSVNGQTLPFNVTVTPAAAANLTLSGLPNTVVAGTAVAATLTARDAFGNLATGYRGTVSFTSSDSAASLPAAAFTANDAGVVTVPVTFRTRGTRDLRASDGVLTAAASIGVTPAAAVVTLTGVPATVVAGQPFLVELAARDAFGNAVTDFAGPITVAADDATAVLPPSVAFAALDAGRLTFPVEFRTAGARVLTVTAGDTVLSRPLTVLPAAAARVAVTAPADVDEGAAFAVTLALSDAFGNPATNFAGTIRFASSDTGATLPADLPVTGDAAIVNGFVLRAIGGQTVTATVVGGPGGSAAVAVRDLPIAGVAVNLDSSAIDEGQSVTLTGTITDPGPDAAATVTLDWGDGRMDSVALAAGTRTFTARHIFINDGSFTVNVSAADPQGNRVTASTAVEVANVPPAFTLKPNANVILLTGEPGAVMAAFADPGADDAFTLELDFGDGREPVIVPLAGPGPIPLGLRFDAEGTFDVRVTVRDGDGGEAGESFRALVLPGGTENVKILIVAPGTTATVATKGAGASFTNEGADGGPAVLVIGTIGERYLPAAVEGKTASYELRTANTDDGDAATLTFAVPAGGNPLALPEIRFYDRETKSYRPLSPSTRLADAIRYDPVRRTITVVFDATSFPKVTELRGTVFTISVPSAPPPNNLAFTLEGTDGTGLSASVGRAERGPAPTTGLTGGGEITLTLAPSEGVRRSGGRREESQTESGTGEHADWIKWAKVAGRLAEVMQDWMARAEETVANPAPPEEAPVRPAEVRPEAEVQPVSDEDGAMFDDDRLTALAAAAILQIEDTHDKIALPPVEAVARSATAWWVVDQDASIEGLDRVPLEQPAHDRSAALAGALWLGGVALQASWPERSRAEEDEDEDEDKPTGA